MFNVNDLYELLKTQDVDDVRAAFNLALDEAESRREKSVYKFGTHELPDDFFHRLDSNDTTMEDVVLLMYTVLYRDYPEMRKSIENVDIPAETKVIADILNVLNAPNDKNVQKLMDQMFGPITGVITLSDQEKKNLNDKDSIKNFLKLFH